MPRPLDGRRRGRPRFDDEGLVVEKWDAWNMTAGRRDPPPPWGLFRQRDA